MNRLVIAAATAVLVLGATLAQAAPPAKMTDAQVRREIIKESLAQYPGSCPCPYNVDRGGRRCGRRSAYSRPGGYSPECYPSDISKQEVKAWRARHSRG